MPLNARCSARCRPREARWCAALDHRVTADDGRQRRASSRLCVLRQHTGSQCGRALHFWPPLPDRCQALILSASASTMFVPVRPCASRQVFIDSTVPVVEHYEQQGKVARINADRAADDIYREVRRLFLEF